MYTIAVMSSDRNFEKVQGPLNYLLATFMICMVLGMIIGTILMVWRNFRKRRSGVKRLSEIMTRIRSSTTSSHSKELPEEERESVGGSGGKWVNLRSNMSNRFNHLCRTYLGNDLE